MKTKDVLYRLQELQGRISGGDEKFDAERREAMERARFAVAAMGQLTEEGQRLVWYMPEAVNELAKTINEKIDEAVLYGDRR